MSFTNILKILLILVTFFAIVLLYVMEIDYFSNTIDVNRLIFWSLLTAALIGGIVGWIFSLYTNVLLEKFQLILSIAVLFATLGPLAGSLSNRLLASDEILERRCRVVNYEPFSTSIMGIPKDQNFREEGHALTVYVRGERERFVYRYDAWPDIEGGQILGLSFKRGFWGYDLLLTELKLEDTIDPSSLPGTLD